MSDANLQEQILDALMTVRALRRDYERRGEPEPFGADLEGADALLERLATEHTAYLFLMRDLSGARDPSSMASLFVTFLTYLRQDYRRHAQPDDETYERFCRVMAELYAAAKDARTDLRLR